MTIRFFILALFVMSQSAIADIDSKALVEGCREYVAIYDKREKRRLLAAVSTSVEEAMRAGLCRGMLEEHHQHQRYNCDSSWYKQAAFIAEQDPENYFYTRETLLDQACDR